MLSLVCAVGLRVVTFDEIKELETRNVVVFFDSKDAAQKDTLDVMKKIEQNTQKADFFAVDKQNEKNEAIFNHSIFQTLPQLFVLLPEEHFSEPMLAKFSPDAAAAFVAMKTFQLADNAVEEPKSRAEMLDKEAFVLYVAEECSRCAAGVLAVQRAAQHLKVGFKLVNCSTQTGQALCKESGIENVPTVWYVLDGVPSEVSNYVTGWCLEEHKKAQQERESRKTRKIQPQKPKDQPQVEAEAEEQQPSAVDSKTRLEFLEHKVEELQALLAQLKKPGQQKQEL